MKKFALLSLDGGGVKGLSSLRILQRIMNSINAQSPPKPCEYFDMICGTSTGGLIAIMLGRLEMSVEECISEYKTLSSKVFTKVRSRLSFTGNIHGRFDHEALEESLKDLLRRLGLSENELLKQKCESKCKVFVCCMSQQTSDIVVLPSYESKLWNSSILGGLRIWEAARATSAATSFFDPIIISGQVFADGATGANNPVYELWSEAISSFKPPDDNTWKLEDHLCCLISIGTGVPSTKPFGPHIAEVAKAIKSIAIDSECRSQQFQRNHTDLLQQGILFRFSVMQGMRGIGLEDADRLGDIEAITDRYCAMQEISLQLECCAGKLKDLLWTTNILKTINVRHQRILNSMKHFYKEVHRVDSPDANLYFHTVAFQKWWADKSPTIVCTTPSSIAFPLASSLCRFIKAESNSHVIYLDCLCLASVWKNWPVLRVQELQHDSELDMKHRVSLLEPLFYFLVDRCENPRETLEAYYGSLSVSESSTLEAKIQRCDVDNEKALLPLIAYFLQSCKTRTVLVIDSMDVLEDIDRHELAAHVSWLRESGLRIQLLFCGVSALISSNTVTITDIVSAETEIEECLASLTFDEINVRKSQISRAADGTASWILTHPTYLRFSTERSGILWLQGNPGSGKSVLARSIQERLSATTYLTGDWFYHKRRGGRFVQHESLVRSLLVHLLQQAPSLFSECFAHSYRTMEPRDSRQWTWQHLSETLVRVCQTSQPIICIIDALDEAESFDIVNLLKLATVEGSSARFIILSRPNAFLNQKLSQLPCIQVQDENREDIARIIDLGLQSVSRFIHQLDCKHIAPLSSTSRRLPRHGVPRRSRNRTLATAGEREAKTLHIIREILQESANGCILWVKLVLDKLILETSENPSTTLEELVKLVHSIPKELTDYYDLIAKEIIASRSPQTVQETKQALMWICATEVGATTLEELWEALALMKTRNQAKTLREIWELQIPIRSYDELWHKVQWLCGPFVEILNSGLSAEESRMYHCSGVSVVQPMHQSVRDFLCQTGPSGGLHFTLNQANSLVHRSLQHYLHLSCSEGHVLSQSGPHETEFVMDWLNDQKLRRLAILSMLQETDFMVPPRIVCWNIETPAPGSSDELLTESLKRSKPFKDGQCARMINVGRLFYHTCSEGLTTAVENLLTMTRIWQEPSSTRLLVSSCVAFAVSLTPTKSLKFDFETGAPEFPRFQRREVLGVSRAENASKSDGFDPDATMTDAGNMQPPLMVSEPDQGPDLSDAGIVIAYSKLLPTTAASWATCPWDVKISLDKSPSFREFLIRFPEWCPCLDLLCGSKSRLVRLARPSKDIELSEEDHELGNAELNIAADEDIEEAVSVFVLGLQKGRV